MSFDPQRFVRRTGGTSKGGGSFADVVQYSAQALDSGQEGGSSIAYQPTGANQGAFRVRDAGIYSVTAIVSQSAAAALIAEIRAGSAVDNNVSDANTRARVDRSEITAHDVTLTWIGRLRENDFVWVNNGGTPSADADENQISIAQLG